MRETEMFTTAYLWMPGLIVHHYCRPLAMRSEPEGTRFGRQMVSRTVHRHWGQQ